MMTFGQRIKKAREDAGLDMSELARRLKAMGHKTAAPQSIQAIENPKKAIKSSKFTVDIAKITGYSAEWLSSGTGPMKPDREEPMQIINFAGRIGAGERVVPFDDYEAVPYPPGEGPRTILVPRRLGSVVGAEISGDSMWPRYEPGEVVAYSDGNLDPRDHINQECVVKLDDGHMYLKFLRPGSKRGFFTLISVKGPPILDARVTWAAPVKWPERASGKWKDGEF